MSAERAAVRRAATLLAGSGGAQLIALALAPLLTRLYDPAAFGMFGIFVALTTLVAAVASAGLENAIVLERDREARRLAFGLSLALAAGIAAASGLLTGLAQAAGLLALPPGTPVLAGLSIFALSSGQTLVNRALSVERPHAVAAGRLLRGAGVGLAQTALALHAASGLSLIEGGLAGQGLAALATALLLRGTPGPRLGTRADRSRLLGRHGALLRWSAPQTLLNNLGNAAVPALIGRLAGTAEAGAFTLANRVVMLPAVTVGEAARQSLLASMSPLAHDDAALARLALRASLVLGLPLALLSAALLATGPSLFGILFGPRWQDAGRLAGLLLAAQAAGIANIPAVTIITVRGWQRALFAFNAATLPVRLGALVLALPDGVATALAAWSGLSCLASLAVTAATLARLRPPLLQEMPG